MNCEKCKALLSDYMDGLLDGDQLDALSEHLSSCSTCGEYVLEYERIAREMRDIQAPKLSSVDKNRVLSGIRRENAVDAPFTFFPRWAVAFAAAACLMVGFWIRGAIAPEATKPIPTQLVYEQDIGRCATLFDELAVIDSPALYRRQAQGSFWRPERNGPEPAVPANLVSHGPFELSEPNVVAADGEYCAPFVTPFGQVAVLHLAKDLHAPPDGAFVVSKDPEQVMFHRVTWADAGWRWTLESRLPAGYLLELAMEIQAKKQGVFGGR